MKNGTNGTSKGGYVYIVKAEGIPVYKIGMAEVSDARLQTLQAGSPVRLELLHSVWCYDARQAEVMLHRRFATKRLHNEWFVLSPLEVAQAVSALSGDHLAEQQMRQDEIMERVRQLFLSGKSQTEIIAEVWGVSQKGRAWQQAAQELNNVLRSLLHQTTARTA